ncbi:iron-sulfur cluster carrier protein ApbC [Thalassomonas haliotis]|uniref:Iron-sulfur cluster carrier protein n=1 Tax=Thalassomonas haliotis TaxID=485448 RepID=A0ABY7VK04_9GAMM|nr:iron-sulfur cluster carrier protein ApbC [Thalassomonas haliotis]WDE14074.1 iron-sulfur cluster carrier protein ApbC [Thalassomonas haliotis]
MFGKFFSSKAETALNSGDIKQLIADTLTEYRSEIFPGGILPLCTDFNISHQGKKITVALTVPFPCAFELGQVADNLSEALQTAVTFDVNLQVKPIRSHEIAKVGNIIAVASGKGGVGKSTTTVNLAYALMAEGAKVGILDADIYGPSIPTMLGLKNEKPTSKDGKLMTPLNAQGLDAMSIGFLVPDEEATVWRGPMASSAFSQLLNETDWSDLDYLLIDMPPGTGDIQLTLAQKVPVAAAVVVTTPQDIALADAAKGIIMFDKVQVPVLGVVENMSYHLCEHCGEKSHLFGQGGGGDIADSYKTRLLGQLPLDIAIRQDADLGKSEIIENSAGEIALLYRKIARNMAAQLFYQLDNRSPDTAEVITL